jgi:3'-5' exoribonuclease
MKKLNPINTFTEGDKVQGFYLCIDKHLRFTRGGDLYIDLELRDVTGHISAKIWDNVSLLNDKFSAGNAVAVSGQVEIFLEKPQLIIKKINKATIQHYGRYGFDPSMVVPSSKKDPKKMWAQIEQLIDGIKNSSIKRLIKIVYNSNKKRLLVIPGSINMHYSYRSGYMEQIISTSSVAKKICAIYNVDRDLVLAGIFLHGIGKVSEINSEYEVDFTTEGYLIGHSVISRDIVKEAIQKIKNFPRNFSEMIEHIILNCNNALGFDFQKQPLFPEALLVRHIIVLDAKMNLISDVLSKDQEKGYFTSRHNFFKVPIFKNDESE